MGLGFDEPGPLARAAGIAFGALFGVAGGFIAELLVTGLTDTMVAALPGLRGAGSIAFDLATALVPACVFLWASRNPRADASARAMGIAAFATLAVLIAGELSGLVVVDRTHVAFYLVPSASKPK